MRLLVDITDLTASVFGVDVCGIWVTVSRRLARVWTTNSSVLARSSPSGSTLPSIFTSLVSSAIAISFEVQRGRQW